MVKLPSCSNLQDDVYIVFIVEVAVHFDDVGVVEIHLDFQLSDKLLCNLLFFQQSLLYHFQSTHKTCILLSK